VSETLTQNNPPENAFEWFTGLAAFAFIAMSLSIFAYGLYGPQMTAGLDSACAEAAFNSGKKLEELGNYDQAIQRFRQAMEGRFQSEEQQFICGRSIGDLLFRQNRYAEAVEAYRALPDGAFANAGAYPGYVNALRMERQFDDALALGKIWLGKAESENDQQQLQWAHHALMRIAGETGDAEALLRHAEYLAAQDKASDANIVLAKIYAGKGDVDGALALLATFGQNSNDARLRDEAKKLARELEARKQ